MTSMSNRVAKSLAAAVVTAAALGGCAMSPCRACTGKKCGAQTSAKCGACKAKCGACSGKMK